MTGKSQRPGSWEPLLLLDSASANYRQSAALRTPCHLLSSSHPPTPHHLPLQPLQGGGDGGVDKCNSWCKLSFYPMIMVWLACLTFQGPPTPPSRLCSIKLKRRCRCRSAAGEIVAEHPCTSFSFSVQTDLVSAPPLLSSRLPQCFFFLFFISFFFFSFFFFFSVRALFAHRQEMSPCREIHSSSRVFAT